MILRTSMLVSLLGLKGYIMRGTLLLLSLCFRYLFCWLFSFSILRVTSQHNFYNLVNPNQVNLYGRPPNATNDALWEKALRENPNPSWSVSTYRP